MTIRFIMEVPQKILTDALISCVENNFMTRAWCSEMKPNSGLKLYKEADQPLWYTMPEIFRDHVTPDLELFDVVEFDEATGEETFHTVTPGKIAAGIKLMAKNHTKHFADLLDESGDAITSDILLQCIVLNDVVYG